MLTIFWHQLKRDINLSLRQKSDMVMGGAFFLMAMTLFPLAIGPDAMMLAKIAPGIVWSLALLVVILSLDRIFQSDYRDGSLDIILLAQAPLSLIVGARFFAHWLTSTGPLIVIAPLIALMLNVPLEVMGALSLSLVLGTPSLSLIGGLGSALVLGARRARILVALLVLPLYSPILVFAMGAVEAALLGRSQAPALYLLSACLLAFIPLCCYGAALALSYLDDERVD